jgi:hypothetical protein
MNVECISVRFGILSFHHTTLLASKDVCIVLYRSKNVMLKYLHIIHSYTHILS